MMQVLNYHSTLSFSATIPIKKTTHVLPKALSPRKANYLFRAPSKKPNFARSSWRKDTALSGRSASSLMAPMSCWEITNRTLNTRRKNVKTSERNTIVATGRGATLFTGMKPCLPDSNPIGLICSWRWFGLRAGGSLECWRFCEW